MARPTKYAQPMTARERKADQRRRERERASAATIIPFPTTANPVGELVVWSRDVLRVPVGHPLAGAPMELPAFAVDFLRAGWNAHESAMCTGRKNSKSAICAVLALGFLVGPLRYSGWRGAVASLSKEKAGELRSQIEAIALASSLEGLRFRRAPYPGKVESETGSLEILSSDRTAGHSSSFDLVLIDETGLMPERSRELLAGLRSSTSAKGGRTIHISVRGDSPLYAEILSNPAVVSRVYMAPDGCALDDEAAWKAANPGLGTIKSRSYMRAEVERIRGAPGDEPSFRAFDLNQRLDPTREMIFSPDDLRQCFADELPARAGPAYLGFDFGEATSATACTAIFRKLAGWNAGWHTAPFRPYRTVHGATTRHTCRWWNVASSGSIRGASCIPINILADVQADLAGVRVQAAAADSYKDSEAKDFLDRAAVRWPIDFRRVGAGKDGGKDVRSLQRLVLNRKLAMLPSLALVTAISKSTIRRDPNGNPGLDKSTSRGRIDVLSSAVIAAGLAAPAFDRPPRRRLRSMIAG